MTADDLVTEGEISAIALSYLLRIFHEFVWTTQILVWYNGHDSCIESCESVDIKVLTYDIVSKYQW